MTQSLVEPAAASIAPSLPVVTSSSSSSSSSTSSAAHSSASPSPSPTITYKSSSIHLSKIPELLSQKSSPPSASLKADPCSAYGCCSPSTSPQLRHASHPHHQPAPPALSLSSKTTNALSSPVLCPSSPQISYHTHDDACVTRSTEDAFTLSLESYQADAEEDEPEEQKRRYSTDKDSQLADAAIMHAFQHPVQRSFSTDQFRPPRATRIYSADDASGEDADGITEVDLAKHMSEGDDDDHGTDVSSVGVVLCGPDKTITHINDAFTRITGYTADDLLGSPSLSLLQGQDTSTQALSTIREAISTQTSCKVCLINYRKDKTPFWNLLTIVPMLNSNSGRVDAWIGIQRLHRPKPYIDRLLRMFPWTSHLPNSHMHQQQKQKKLLRHRSTPQQRNQRMLAGPSHSTSASVEPSAANKSHPRVAALNGTATNGLAKTTLSRFSSVEEHTDGEQDLDLDNRLLAEPTPVSFIAETDLPTQRGVFRVRAYKDLAKVSAANGHSHLLGSESEIICIIAGKIENHANVPVRVHDACFTSEVLGSLKCDCKEQLDWSMEYIQKRAQRKQNGHANGNGNGVNQSAHTHSYSHPSSPTGVGGMVIYMPQEGRGIGLANKLKAYSLQSGLGLDTVDANRALGMPDDLRSYNCVPSILESLGITSIRLMTNNPRKQEVLERLGVTVSSRIPVVVEPNSTLSARYMATKASRMQHSLGAAPPTM